jgi:hypothetical protein
MFSVNSKQNKNYSSVAEPDPLVRGMDPAPAPAPDPSIIKQKQSEKT